MIVTNSQGKIFYGMHFYPGVAQYQEAGGDPYRVFLNEDTIRSMDPSFAGRPVFVDHVDGVDERVDDLRKNADGWVIESFFNAADGKHWVKFIVVTERAIKAVEKGMRLSNAYMPETFGMGGIWSGVDYAKEILSGVYEHLAIVDNPRYVESEILTPEQFKLYNEKKTIELTRLKNSNDKKETPVMSKLKFWKTTKVENAIDENTVVTLPKSGKEISIIQLVNAADEHEEAKKKNEIMADSSHKVKLFDESMCSVGELVDRHKVMHDEMSALKAVKDETETEIDLAKKEVDSESSKDNEDDVDADDESVDNEEKEEKEEDKKDNADEEEKDAKDKKDKKSNAADLAVAKKKAAKEKADKLKNANVTKPAEVPQVVYNSEDRVARGKSRYGA